MQSAFVKNVLTLFSGKAIAAAIAMLFVPVISRLFEPAHFGIAAFFVSIFTIIGPVSTFCYERAIVLPKKQKNAIQLVWLALALLVASSLFFLFMLILSEVTDIALPFIENVGWWKWFLPLALFLTGLISIAENLLVRMKSFKLIASSDVSQSLGITISRISLGFLSGSSVGALISGYLIGVALKLVVIGRSLILVFQKDDRYSLGGIKEIATEYKDFPVYNTPARFVRTFSQNLPVLMLGFMFSPAVAGFYAMANRLVRMPMDIAASAVRRAYLQRAAEMNNEGVKLYGMLVKFTIVLALLGAIPLAFLWYEGQVIFSWLLGDRWSEAGYYAQLLSPWLFSIWVTTPSSALVLVLRRQKLWLKIQVSIMTILIAVFFYANLKGENSTNTLKMFVATATLSNISIIIIMFRIVFLVEKRRVHD